MVEYRQRLRVMLSASQASYELERGSICSDLKYYYYILYFYPYEIHPFQKEFDTIIRDHVILISGSIDGLQNSHHSLNNTIMVVSRNLSLIDIYINYIDKTVGSYICTLKEQIKEQLKINKTRIEESLDNIETRIQVILSSLRGYIGEQLKAIVGQLQAINYRILLDIVHIITELHRVECKVHDLKSEAENKLEEIIREHCLSSEITLTVCSNLDQLSKTVLSQICCTVGRLGEYIKHTVNFSGIICEYLKSINYPQILGSLRINSLIIFVNKIERSIICLQHDYTQSLQSMTQELYKSFDQIYTEVDRFQNEFNVVEVTKINEIKIRIGKYLIGSSYVDQSIQRIYGLPNGTTVGTVFYPSVDSLNMNLINFVKQIESFKKELSNTKKLLIGLFFIKLYNGKLKRYIPKSPVTIDKLKKIIEKMGSLSEKRESELYDIVEKRCSSLYYLYIDFMRGVVEKLIKKIELIKSDLKSSLSGYYLQNVKSKLDQINLEMSKLETHGRNINDMFYVLLGVRGLKIIRKKVEELKESIQKLNSDKEKLDSVLVNLKSIESYIEELKSTVVRLKSSSDMARSLERIQELSNKVSEENKSIEVLKSDFLQSLKEDSGQSKYLDGIERKFDDIGKIVDEITAKLGHCSKKQNSGDICNIKLTIQSIKTQEIDSIKENIIEVKTVELIIKSRHEQYTKKFTDFNQKLLELETCLDHLIRDFLSCSLCTTIFKLKRQLRDTVGDCPDSSSSCNTCLRNSVLNDKVTKLEEQLYTYSRLVLEHSSVLESKLLVSKLYRCCAKVEQTVTTLMKADECCCVCSYKRREKEGTERSRSQNRNANVNVNDADKMQTRLELKSYEEVKSQFKKLMGLEGNHLCLCLVTRFVMYQSVRKTLLFLVLLDIDLTGNISRKHPKLFCYHAFKGQFCLLMMLAISVFEKLADCIKQRYSCICNTDAKCCCKDRDKPEGDNAANTATTCKEDCTACKLRVKPCCECYKSQDPQGCKGGNCGCNCEKGKEGKKGESDCPCNKDRTDKCRCYICFCCYWDDSLYPWFISVILYICHLVDDAFSLGYWDVQQAMQLLSNLLSQLEAMSCDRDKKAETEELTEAQPGFVELELQQSKEASVSVDSKTTNTPSLSLNLERTIIKNSIEQVSIPSPKITSPNGKKPCCRCDNICKLCINFQALYRVIAMARQTFYWVSKPIKFTRFGIVMSGKKGGSREIGMYYMEYYGPIINKLTVTYYKVLEALSKYNFNICQQKYLMEFLSYLSFKLLTHETFNPLTGYQIRYVLDRESKRYMSLLEVKNKPKPGEKQEKNNQCLKWNCRICKNHKFAIPLLKALQSFLKPFMQGTKAASGSGPNTDPDTKELKEKCECDKCCLICLQSGDIMLFIREMLEAIESYSKETKAKGSSIPDGTLMSITQTLSVTRVMTIEKNEKCQCTLVFDYFKYLLQVLRTGKISEAEPEPDGKATITAQKTIAGSRRATVSIGPAPTTPKEPAPPTTTTTTTTKKEGEPVIFVGLKKMLEEFFDKDYFKCGCESVIQCCCCCKCEECGTGKCGDCHGKGNGNGHGSGHQANGDSGQAAGNGQGNCPCQDGKEDKKCCCETKPGEKKTCNCTDGKPPAKDCECCCLSCCADKENEDKKPTQPEKESEGKEKDASNLRSDEDSKEKAKGGKEGKKEGQKKEGEKKEGEKKEGEKKEGTNKCPCKKKKKKDKPKTHCKNNKKYKDKRCCCKCCPDTNGGETKGNGGNNGSGNGAAATTSSPTATNPKDDKDCCCCCKCKDKCGNNTSGSAGGGGSSSSTSGCKCPNGMKPQTSVQPNGNDKCKCYCCFECKHEKSALKSICKQLAYDLKSSILVLSKLASNLSIECCQIYP